MLSALILAAGRGSRMADLTERVPKPLLMVDDKSLIEHQILRLRQAGTSNIIINTAWLGSLIESTIGDGKRFGVRIRYSPEPAGALETAGGIANALDLIDTDPFIVVNADVWIDRPYSELSFLSALDNAPQSASHLVLVDNPAFHPSGDFLLSSDQQVSDPQTPEPDGSAQLEHKAATRLTFSGIGVYRKILFTNLPSRRCALGPLLREAMALRRVTGEYFGGRWISVDTPERLQTVRQWQKQLSCKKTNKPRSD